MIVQPSPTDPECPSASAHVVIPGLVLIEDFISEEEEAALLHVADGDQGIHWQDVISRRVQHYGYPTATTAMCYINTIWSHIGHGDMQ